MNTTLPRRATCRPARRMRAELARAVDRRPHRWVFPLVTATAALAVSGLVLGLVPWDRSGLTTADTPPSSPTISPAPGVPGLTADRAREIADGTFLARIVHPADWSPPQNRPFGKVRAYGEDGALIGESN